MQAGFISKLYNVKRILFPVILFLCISGETTAQSGTGHNPFSRFGAGIPYEFGISRNEAMAGCGIAAPDQDYPNFLNPALLHFNRKVNLNSDFRYQFRRLEQSGQTVLRQGSAGPALLSLLIPLGETISAGAGIRPYSSREFTYQSIRRAGTDSIGLRTRGSGGLSQAFLSFGLRINRHISLGLEGSYVFGTLEDSITFGVLPSTINYTFSNLLKRRVSQFLLRPGLHLMSVVSKEKGVFIGGGFSTELGSRLSTRRYNQFSIPGTFVLDTLEDGISGYIVRPLSMKAGLALFSPQSWSASAEAEFINADNLSPEDGIRYRNTLSWRFSGEFCPGTKRSTSYLNLITYRAGFQFRELPFEYAGNGLRDVRITAGASFPVIRKESKFSRPLINLSLAIGQRGISAANLGSERYFQVSLGFTLNDFLWFNRYKID